MRQRAARARVTVSRCREPGRARALKSPTAGSESEQLSLSSRCFPEQLLLLLPLPQGAGRASLSPIINTTFSITPRLMAVTIVTQKGLVIPIYKTKKI